MIKIKKDKLRFLTKVQFERMAGENQGPMKAHDFFKKQKVNQAVFVPKSEWPYKSNPSAHLADMSKRTGKKWTERKIEGGWLELRIK